MVEEAAMICVLLGIIDPQADTVITSYDGTRVWLKEAFDRKGQPIGVAACCPECAPCEWHEALRRVGHRGLRCRTTPAP